MLKRNIKKIYKSLTDGDWWLDRAAAFLRFLIKRNPVGLFKKDFNRKHPYWAASISGIVLIVIIFFSSWFLFSWINGAKADWYDETWRFRKQLYFNNSAQSSTLSDFPVMIRLGGDNFDFTNAKNDGSDLRFTDSNGTTLLDYEIEKYDKSSQEAIVWVRVPAINGSSTTDSIFVYWGNSSASDAQDTDATWSSEYKGIYHFKENDTNNVFADSSGNANDLQTLEDSSESHDENGKSGGSLYSADWPNDLPNQAGATSEAYPSVKLDFNDFPVVAFQDQTNLDLILVHCNDRECKGEDESVEVLDSSGSTGYFPSLQIDSNGNPVVAYYDSTAGDLNIIHCNDVNCSGGDEAIYSPDTSGTTGQYPFMLLDSSGYPVVAYYDSSATDVNLLHCNDAACAGGDDSVQTIEGTGVFGNYLGGISFAFDNNGYPVISYHDGTNTDLKVAHCNDAACSGGNESIVTAVASANSVGVRNSIKLDSNGYPMIAYFDSTISDLLYIHCADVNCSGAVTPKTLTASSYDYPWMEVNTDGNPIIITGGSYPRLFLCSDNDCTVDYEANITNFNQSSSIVPSMDIDSDGYPVVVAYARSRTELFYEVDVYTTNPRIKQGYDGDFNFGTGDFTASMWFKTRRNAANNYLLTRYDNDQGFKVWLDYGGHPCFGVDDDSSYGPDDSACTTNSLIERNVDNGLAATVSEVSMELDASGYPVIAYFDGNSSHYDLDIIHCNDVNCSGGDEYKYQVDTVGDVGRSPSMTLDANGYPVIAYHDNTNNDLKIVHCGDANCSSGNVIQTLDGTGDVGYYPSVKLDASGYPIVGYYDTTNTAIKLAHCNDVNCTGGDESIVTVDNTEVDRPYVSTTWLKLDNNGYPVMAYYNDSADDLKIAHCNDVNCSGGDESITTPAVSGSTGRYAALEIDSSGFPVVAYYNSTTWDLKLMKCNDVNCSGGDEAISAIEDNKDSGYYYIDLELGQNDIPKILHTSLAQWMQVLTVCGNATCSSGNTNSYIRQDPYNYYYGSLELDSNGYPVIAMSRAGDLTLLHLDNPTSYTDENAYDDQQWHHLVAVKNGTSSIKLYVDGQEVATDTSMAAGGTLSSDSAELHVGENLLTIGNYKYWVDSFSGQIDEVQIDNTARSADWIAAQYLSENDEFINPGVMEESPSANNPVAYWKFDEGNGIVANDSTWKKTGSITNLVTNPSFENNTTGWSVSGATITSTAETRAVVGSKYAKVVGSGSGTYPRTVYTFSGLPVGNYALQFRYKADNATASNGFWYAWAFQPSATSLATGVFSNTGISDTDGWVTVRSTFTVASGQSDIQLWFYLNGNATSTGTLLLDGMQVESGSVINRYCDGSLIGNGEYDWNGTSHASTSTCDLGTDGQVDGPMWKNESECASGKCLNFDGINDYVNMGDVLDVGTGNFTINAWVKSTSIATGNNNGIVYKRGTAYGYSPGYRLNMPNGQFNFHIADGTNFQSVTVGSIGQYNDGKWHFVSAVATRGSEMRIYVDGESKGFVVENNVGNIDTTATFGIGAYNGSYHFFSGSIDEVKIYPFARSAEQVKMDYNSGLAGSGAAEGSAQSFGGKSDKWLTDGLVGHWKMDEASWNETSGEVKDASGNNNNGTASGGATTGVSKYGNGGSFDGTDDYVNMGSPTQYQFINTSSFSMSAWIKTNDLSGFEHIIGKGFYDYRLAKSDGTISFRLNSNQLTATTPTLLNTSDWFHVVAVYDGITKTAKVYVNGTQQATNTNTNVNWTGVSANFQIGNSPNESYYFNGKIDEARTYNRVLSPEEVRKLYEYAPGPIAYYKLDEKDGATFSDASGSGSPSGTLVNSPSWITGKYGSGLGFASNYATINDISTLRPGTGDFTVGFWIKTPFTNIGGSGSWPNIFLKGLTTSAPAGTWGFLGSSNSTNRINFAQSSDAGGSFDASLTTATLSDGWHYITARRTGATTQLYADGVFVSEDTTAGSNLNSAANFYVGGNTADTTYFSGNIDEIKYYNYARTTDQIVEDMNGGGSDADSGGATIEPWAYWKMDEGSGGTTKNAGSGAMALDGTLAGTTLPSWSNDGKFGKALSFTNGYVQTPSQAVHSSFTYSAWFKPTSAFVEWAAVITNLKYSAPASGINIVPRNGSVRICYGDGVNSYSNYTVTVPEIVLNQWNYAAVSYDGVNIKLFVNGKLKDSRAATVVQTSQSVRMGIWAANYNEYLFNGLIDEVKIYNAALSEDEIEADFNQGESAVMSMAGMTVGGEPDGSANAEYCIPGDSTSCNAPVGEWKFDEKGGTTVGDSSGNNLAGTWNGAGNHWNVGKVGTAGQFNGTDDYIQVEQNVQLAPADISVSMWIYPTSWTHQVHTALLAQRTTVDNGLLLFILSQGNLNFDWGNGSNQNRWDTGYQPPLNQWTHLTITRNPSGRNLYVNGLLKASTTVAGGPITNSTFRIGADTLANQYNFQGKIDQVRFYNYTRTPAQIAYDFNRGAPLGWWKFDECQGGTANDSSGNGNNATINIGSGGTQTSAGTCTNLGTAWGNGTNGKFNGSLNFDGTDDYLQTASLYRNDDITWSAWIKTVGNGSVAGTNYGNASYFWHGGISVATGKARMEIGYVDSTYRYQLGTKTVNDGNWHHVAMTSNSSGSRLYVDGVLDASSSYYVGQVAGSSEQITCIGVKCRPAASNIEFFPGQIDDVRIYNYSLTEAQIKNVMNDASALRFGD